MDKFERDIERDLHEARPAPSGPLLDTLVSRVQATPIPVRRGSWSLRLAALASVVMLAGLGAVGGVSVAAGVSQHAAKAATSSGHNQSGDDHEVEGRHGGKDAPSDKRSVALCLNGQTVVRWFKVKKASKLIAKGKARPAVGDPLACEVI